MNFDFSKFFEAASDEIERRKEAAALATERFVAIKVMGQAQENCPLETGALMASATTGDAIVSGNTVTVECGFNVSYAAARHERPPEYDAGQKVNPSGTAGNKFLERALRDATPLFVPYIKQELGM